MISKENLNDEGRDLYDQGFKFIVNNNCSKYRVEAVYSRQFVKQLKKYQCHLGSLDKETCNKRIKCRKAKFRIGLSNPIKEKKYLI